MKKIFLSSIISLIAFNGFSQSKQNFRKEFQTNSGIYGYVNLSTKPTTVGFGYIWVQQDAVVIEGIRSQGKNFGGTSLSNYGVSFPFNCSNCYFYANGEATMIINGTAYYGNFQKGGSINSGGIGKTNQPVNFSQQAKQLHNEAVKNLGYSLWEKTGNVNSINISGVSGADFGKVTRALEKHNTDLKNKIAQENNSKQQQTTTKNEKSNKSTDTDYWGEKKSSTNNNSSNNDNTQITETKSEKAVREYKESVEKQNKEREAALNGNFKSAENTYYVKAVSSATLSSLNGDYKAATQQYTQLALNGISSGNNRNKIVGATGAILSAWQNAANQRRQRELDYQRRKDAFDNQAAKYRREVKKIINGRQTLVNQPKLKSLINEDGTNFKPIYLYFAYVDKDYAYSKENIDFYDNKMKIDFNEISKVQFSQVFAFFPYSNGQYPLIGDIKKKILNEHFRNKSNNYEVFFFPWERSVKNIVKSLQNNMNKAVSQHYFSNAMPSDKNEIEFLISKTSTTQTKDYWTGEKVKKKETKKTDYWKN